MTRARLRVGPTGGRILARCSQLLGGADGALLRDSTQDTWGTKGWHWTEGCARGEVNVSSAVVVVRATNSSCSGRLTGAPTERCAQLRRDPFAQSRWRGLLQV